MVKPGATVRVVYEGGFNVPGSVPWKDGERVNSWGGRRSRPAHIKGCRLACIISVYLRPPVVILRPVGYYSVRGGIWNGGAIVGTGTSISVGRLASNASASAVARLSGSARIPLAPNASATCAKLGL